MSELPVVVLGLAQHPVLSATRGVIVATFLPQVLRRTCRTSALFRTIHGDARRRLPWHRITLPEESWPRLTPCLGHLLQDLTARTILHPILLVDTAVQLRPPSRLAATVLDFRCSLRLLRLAPLTFRRHPMPGACLFLLRAALISNIRPPTTMRLRRQDHIILRRPALTALLAQEDLSILIREGNQMLSWNGDVEHGIRAPIRRTYSDPQRAVLCISKLPTTLGLPLQARQLRHKSRVYRELRALTMLSLRQTGRRVPCVLTKLEDHPCTRGRLILAHLALTTDDLARCGNQVSIRT